MLETSFFCTGPPRSGVYVPATVNSPLAPGWMGLRILPCAQSSSRLAPSAVICIAMPLFPQRWESLLSPCCWATAGVQHNANARISAASKRTDIKLLREPVSQQCYPIDGQFPGRTIEGKQFLQFVRNFFDVRAELSYSNASHVSLLPQFPSDNHNNSGHRCVHKHIYITFRRRADQQ